MDFGGLYPERSKSTKAEIKNIDDGIYPPLSYLRSFGADVDPTMINSVCNNRVSRPSDAAIYINFA